MLSKTVCTSRKVNRLPDRATLLYTWLIPHTDDFGHTEGDALTIKGKVVPMRPNTVQEIEQDLELIEFNGLITRYEVDGEKYIEIVNFNDFQTFRSDRKKVAEYPGLDGSFPIDNRSDTTGIPMGENRHVSKGKIREGKGSKGKIREYVYTDEKFNQFWKEYPKKVGKPNAYELWQEINEKDKDKILADVIQRKQDEKWIKGFHKDPERYLKNRQWEDDIIRSTNKGSTKV
jgi:hypothetical protein